MRKKLSQNEKILHYLQAGNSITQRVAVNRFGCYRLSARIADLKKKGYHIVTEVETNKGETGYHARYRLEDKNVQM